MRKKTTHQGLTLQAIAGTYVVLLGFYMDEAACEGLLGFAIHRTDHTQEEAYWLRGQKTFVETDPGLPPGAQHSTREQPIQGFTWSDLTAKPGHDYTYRVLALKGTPRDLQPIAQVSVRVRTESPEGATHDIISIAAPPPPRNMPADSRTQNPATRVRQLLNGCRAPSNAIRSLMLIPNAPWNSSKKIVRQVNRD